MAAEEKEAVVGEGATTKTDEGSAEEAPEVVMADDAA